MKKSVLIFWLSVVALPAQPIPPAEVGTPVIQVVWPGQTIHIEYPDGWLVQGGENFAKYNSWVSSAMLTVLDGKSGEPLHFFRAQTNQMPPARPRPKPRPRLGAPVVAEPPVDEPGSYNSRVAETSAFLDKLGARFTASWNDAQKVADALTWVHELDAEVVFAVSQSDGSISIESLESPATSPDMDKIRHDMTNGDGTVIHGAQPQRSAPAELTRLRNFVLALGPVRLPDTLAKGGDPVRIRGLFRVARMTVTESSVDPNEATNA